MADLLCSRWSSAPLDYSRAPGLNAVFRQKHHTDLTSTLHTSDMFSVTETELEKYYKILTLSLDRNRIILIKGTFLHLNQKIIYLKKIGIIQVQDFDGQTYNADTRD